MRHAQALRGIGWVLLAGWAVGSSGCIHHHYYGQGVQVQEVPATGAVTSHYGSVCEVAPGGGVVVAQTPGRTTVLGGAPPSRVVINSEPMGVRPYGRRAPKFDWRRSEPEGLAARTEGGLAADETTTR